MNVGDLVRFVKQHWEQPGIDYIKDWTGIIVDKVVDDDGTIEELHILWQHSKVSDYPSSWWNRLTYFPFEVISESR
tara:strand:- start:945 stop:1172 length:228 start_codon:yes stop_codon:yes gene_type:complete